MSESGIIKTDARGRVRTPAQRREQLLHEFVQSGVSARKFVELAGIDYLLTFGLAYSVVKSLSHNKAFIFGVSVAAETCLGNVACQSLGQT